MFKQLFIGLGGQGAKSIREIRKVIFEYELNERALHATNATNAQASQFPCAFLSIDSSPDIWNGRAAWVHMGKDLQLTEAERCFLEAGRLTVSAPHIVPWLYSHDRQVAQEQKAIFGGIDRSTPGAQQRRRYGRALFAANIDKVREAIFNAMGRCSSTGNASNSCVINVFCSLGGGTGSGGIVDLICLLRQLYPAHLTCDGYKAYPINLYIYLADDTGVNPSDVQDYFYVNQYAALRDLNSLSTGLFRPHALINSNDYHAGERHEAPTPMDAIIISTNTTSKNHRIGIEEQIKRVAKWAVDRALVTMNSSDSSVVKIATGEDFTTSIVGEPNSKVFVERSYRFANLGFARWECPVKELLLMDTHTIKANSFRQMLYNNLSQTEGYLKQELRLEDKVKAKYTRVDRSIYMLEESIHKGWEDWYEGWSKEKFTTKGQGKKDDALLRDMENAFDKHFKEKVSNAASNSAGDALSLPGRINTLMVALKKNLRLETSTATDIASLLYEGIARDLREDWRDAKIGLTQAVEAANHAIAGAKKDQEQLKLAYEKKLDTGEELAGLLGELNARSDSKNGEWTKLTPLSFAIKGKDFIQAHKEDLINIYTIRTQCAHLQAVMKQLSQYITKLQNFVSSMVQPIDYMEKFIASEEALYKKTNLYRFIYAGEKPGDSHKLEYDYDTRDTRYKSAVDYIRTNVSSGTYTIISNADTLRSIVYESISGGDLSLAQIFGGNGIMQPETAFRLTERAFELAGAMQAQADQELGTKWLGGMVERVKTMPREEFEGKFKSLLTAATFSFNTDETTPLPSNAYSLPGNPLREKWIISFPEGIQLPTSDDVNISTVEALRRAILDATGANSEKISVTLDPDTTKISVWQTEYARPARMAAIVRFLRTQYDNMMQRNQIHDSFWMNIDDLATEMSAGLPFPNEQEKEVLCQAALWFVEQRPDDFTIDEETGEIYCNGTANANIAIYKKFTVQQDDASITKFASAVQEHIRTIIRSDKTVLNQLKESYEKTLDTNDRKVHHTFGPLVENFIKPTLYRIARAENIHGVYPE